LQFGELAHHVGEQVRLGEPGGALGLLYIGMQLLRDGAGQLLDALPFELATQLVVIHHRAQTFDAVGHAVLRS
jgi:hypothetical protein